MNYRNWKKADKPNDVLGFDVYDGGMTDTANTMTGAEFSQALAALGWKQVDFAARTGTTPESVNRWVHDRQPIPALVAAHVRLLLGAAEFHRAHVAPLPRPPRRKAVAKDQPTDGDDA